MCSGGETIRYLFLCPVKLVQFTEVPLGSKLGDVGRIHG